MPPAPADRSGADRGIVDRRQDGTRAGAAADRAHNFRHDNDDDSGAPTAASGAQPSRARDASKGKGKGKGKGRK